MKNKIFKNLSMEKKQKILMHILRSKTNGLLKVTEEAVLLSVGLKRKQFQIRTFNDISSFVKVLDSTKNLNTETIYGEIAMKEINNGNALIDTGIAVMVNAAEDKVRAVDQLLIYIPETRKCKGNCVREKIICEHVESYGADALCCGLQLVQA